MTEEQKQKMAEGRARAAAEKAAAEAEKGDETNQDNRPSYEGPAPTPSFQEPSETQVPLSDVKRLIENAVADAMKKNNAPAPVNLRKPMEHHPHLWRFDGKWVVDFTDRNTDPYIKKKVHAFRKWSDTERQYQSWIELVFHDGSKKELPLTTYADPSNRIPVYCRVLNKEKIDKSYSIGTVEKTDWKVIDGIEKKVGTGVWVDQTVELYEEIYTLQTPEGEIIKVPAYALA